jgi:pantoate--beta-alanine ligase
MGALHPGHLSLIEAAKKQTKFVVASIFVNPTQFNDSDDLNRYPRKEKSDLELLESVGCDMVFLPEVEDIYPQPQDDYEIDLGFLDEVMEGKFRPDHFKGVSMVVERFFSLVQPDVAFFGEKDFQQLAVIRRMTEIRNFNIQIQAVETKREADGLAMSSRNLLLNESQRQQATHLFETLKYGRQLATQMDDVSAIREKMIAFCENSELELEYLELVDNDTLRETQKVENCRACIVAYCGKVRLIDNMALF